MGLAASTLVDRDGEAVPISRLPYPQKAAVTDIEILPSGGGEETEEPLLGITRAPEVTLVSEGQGRELPLDRSRFCYGYVKAGLCLG
jgi:hypothetical protein